MHIFTPSFFILFTWTNFQGMSGFAIQFNKNSFGLAPGAPLSVNCPVLPGISAPTSLSIVTTGPVMKMDPLLKVQMAMKNDIDVFYFECLVPAYVLFVEEGSMERNLFPQMWREIPDEKEKQFSLPFTNKSQGKRALSTTFDLCLFNCSKSFYHMNFSM